MGDACFCCGQPLPEVAAQAAREEKCPFRQAGMTPAAAQFPLSERAFAWRLSYLGAEKTNPKAIPYAWRFASNAHMLAWQEQLAADGCTITARSGERLPPYRKES